VSGQAGGKLAKGQGIAALAIVIPGRRQLLRDLVNQGNSLACCPINITEAYAGLRPHEEGSTKAFLSSLDLLPMTWPIADGKRGQTLNLGDVMIAATALHNGVALLTDNTKDFAMKDLRLYSLPN